MTFFLTTSMEIVTERLTAASAHFVDLTQQLGDVTVFNVATLRSNDHNFSGRNCMLPRRSGLLWLKVFFTNSNQL